MVNVGKSTSHMDLKGSAWKTAVAVNLTLNLKPLKPATVALKHGTFLCFPGVFFK